MPPVKPGQVLLRVRACGVWRSDFHIVAGELPTQRNPLVPGQQIVGEVVDGATAELPLGPESGFCGWPTSTEHVGIAIEAWKISVIRRRSTGYARTPSGRLPRGRRALCGQEVGRRDPFLDSPSSMLSRDRCLFFGAWASALFWAS
jgi:hypothetical protein